MALPPTMQAAAVSEHAQFDPATDRRADRRRRTFLNADVILDNRMSTFNVVVRNRSEAGFLLKTENATLIPKEFALKIAEEPTEYRCLVVRRGPNFLGVKVIDRDERQKVAAKSAQQSDPNADLRAQLAERFPHLTKT